MTVANLELELAALGQPSSCGEPISARLVPEFEILPRCRSHVVALQVRPSPSRPHQLIREGPTTGVYVRVGSTNRRADAELIDELRRFARNEGFDE
jgi:predicted HTH transcriptional regulator